MKKRKNFKLRVKNLVAKYNTKNPYILCEKLNIEVIFTDLKDVKGYFKKILKNKYIVINEQLDEYSKKVVLTHELCHALYHSSKNKLLLKANYLHYSETLENEANEFAAELMLLQYDSYNEEIIQVCDLELKTLEYIKNFLK